MIKYIKYIIIDFIDFKERHSLWKIKMMIDG